MSEQDRVMQFHRLRFRRVRTELAARMLVSNRTGTRYGDIDTHDDGKSASLTPDESC